MSSKQEISRIIARAKKDVRAPGEDDDARTKVAELSASVLELTAALEAQKEKDTVNNRKVLEQAVKQYGIHPAVELLRMVHDGEVSLTQKIMILKELSQYLLPKVKHSEHSHMHDHNIRVVVNKFGDNLENAIDVTPERKVLSR